MSFLTEFNRYSWDQITEQIHQQNHADVERALCKKSQRNLQDFIALVSPAAEAYLEQMAQLSHQLTVKRFGRVMQLYAPMYLSNKCHNICRYCGFSANNRIKRRSLKPNQILDEAKVIKNFGHQHLLLVTGETRKIAVDYMADALTLLSSKFSNLSIETQPFSQEEYVLLKTKGLAGVYLYQETYNQVRYGYHHLKGTKADFKNRLLAHDQTGSAKIHKLGLGVLLGLEDWRTDSTFLAIHLSYLEKRYWQSKFSISFPRLREAAGYHSNGQQKNKHEVTDKHLVQLICAYRIFNENVELSLSTRESQSFRDNAMKLGITTMSVDSRTSPGAYTLGGELEQFSVCDERHSQELAQSLLQNGYDPVWKDWDRCFL